MPGGKKGKEAAAPPASDADAGPSSSSSTALTNQAQATTPSPAEQAALLERIKAQLAAMGMRDAASSAAERQTREAKARYAFWETQPVVQFQGAGGGGARGGAAAEQPNGGGEDDEEDGPIDAPKTVADVKKEPYALAPGFEWSDLDTADPSQIDELYHLLHQNYVEDDSEAFRFRYSPQFLAWALRPPGHRPEWSIGVRASTTTATSPSQQSNDNDTTKPKKGKLLGFISAVPATMGVSGKNVPMVEINFLCVHKRLRSKRLAPLLIKEVTRRVNLQGIWQAAYTAGVVLPVPISEARYWHRPLAPKKLVDVGFCHLPPRMTMKAFTKLHALPVAGSTIGSGLRPFDPTKDAKMVAALLGSYLKTSADGGGHGGGDCRFRMAPVMESEEEVAHWLGPREGVVGCWVVERKVDDPVVLRLLEGGGEEDEGAVVAASAGDGEEAPAELSEEDRLRARSQRAAARRAVKASRDVALAAVEKLGGAGAEAAAAASGSKSGGGKSGSSSKSGSSTSPLFISDLLSFYTISSSVLNHPQHDELRAAYGFYNVPATCSSKALLKELLSLAQQSGHDVFNCLALGDNDGGGAGGGGGNSGNSGNSGAVSASGALKELKFGVGDGILRYYLYNWRAKGAPFSPADVGLVLL